MQLVRERGKWKIQGKKIDDEERERERLRKARELIIDNDNSMSEQVREEGEEEEGEEEEGRKMDESRYTKNKLVQQIRRRDRDEEKDAKNKLMQQIRRRDRDEEKDMKNKDESDAADTKKLRQGIGDEKQ